MQDHLTPNLDDDRTRLVGPSRAISAALATVGLLALIVGLALGWSRHDQLREFSASYLVNYVFFLSISLGALFFVVLQHLVRAGWSVTVRRLAEILAANLPYMAILFLPILAPLWLGMTGPYYKWLSLQAVAADKLPRAKLLYLNLPFFTARAIFYFVVWALLAWFFLKQSLRQDESGDPKLTRRMEKASPAAMILFGVTVTFASFDWLMSLEPAWFSTIFGLYFFAGSVLGALAAWILFALLLQGCGRGKRGQVQFVRSTLRAVPANWTCPLFPLVRQTITVEHYHELGKLLLGFVVFWGYMAFSQYLLIWYANIPEESVWYLARQTGPWAWITVTLLFGHLLIPFLGLLSREAKRRKMLLGIWAAWILLAHWLDIYWLVMPTFAPDRLPLGMTDVCCITAVGCLYLAGVVWTARNCALVPLGDPRLGESLAFENL